MIYQVIKRDGTDVPFEASKIEDAVYKAAVACAIKDEAARSVAGDVCNKVTDHLELVRADKADIESIQDLVESSLIELGYGSVAKAYILYRQKRTDVRESRSHMMKTMFDLTFRDAVESDNQRENANIDADSSMGTMLKYGSEIAKEYYLKEIINPKFAQAHREGRIHIHDLDFFALTTTCTQIDLGKLFEKGFHTGHGYIRTPNSIGSYASLACIVIQANQSDQHGGQSIPAFDYYMAPGVAKTFRTTFLEYGKLEGIVTPENIREIEETFNDRIAQGVTVLDRTTQLVIRSKVLAGDDGKEMRFVRVWLAAMEKTRKATYQAMEALIHNLNTMNSRAGAQVPFSSINYGTGTSPEQRMVTRECLRALDAGLGNGETSIFPIHIYKVKDGVNAKLGDPNYDLFQLACRVSAKRLFPNFEFLDAPFNLEFYKEGDPDTEVATMGCVHGDSVVTYRLNGMTYVESIARLYDRIADIVPAQQRGKSEYMPTSEIDLKIWDSHSNAFVCVKTVLRNRDVDNWRKVTYANGRILIATGDHPLPIDGRGRVFVDDIKAGDIAPISTYVPVPNADEIDEDLAWLLGVIVCDGCLLSGTPSVTLGMDEYDVTSKVLDVAKKLPGSENRKIKTHTRGEKGNYYEVMLGASECESCLCSLFEGAEKNKRHIPQSIFNCKREQRIAFLAGMIDADGYINKHINSRGTGLRIQIGSVNRELAVQQAMLAQSIGLQAKIYETRYNKDNHKTTFRVEFAASSEIINALACGKKKKAAEAAAAYPLCPTVPTLSRIMNIESIDIDALSYDVETESDYFDVNGVVSHNCRTRVMANINGPSTTSGRGNLSFTTINLPRLAIEASNEANPGNGDGATAGAVYALFMHKLDETLDLVIGQLLERFEIQAERHVYNYPFLMGQGVWMDSDKLKREDTVRDVIKHGTLGIGFIGLAEAMKAIFGKNHAESKEVWDHAYKVVERIRNLSDQATKAYHLNFSVIATPAEGLSGRFVRIDRKEFGEIKGVTDRAYYTNSYHVPVYQPVGVFTKIDLEAPFHALCNGGHITYVELDGDVSKNPEAFEEIITYMRHAGIGYGSINHAVDYDPVCGYTGIINDVCPRCGRREGEGIELSRLEELRRQNGGK